MTWNKINMIFSNLKTIVSMVILIAAAAGAITSRVWITEDAVRTEGVADDYKIDISDAARVQYIPSPIPGRQSLKTNNQAVLLRGNLEVPLADEGTIAFWLKPDKTYQTGINEEETQIQLFEIENYCSLAFSNTKSMVELLWTWDKSRGNTQYHDLRMITPRLPGSDWIQLVFRWSADKNIFNCYLNGIPYKPDETTRSLSPGAGSKLTLYASQFAFFEFLASDKMLEGSRLKEIIYDEPFEALEHSLGIKDLNKILLDQAQGERVYRNTLRSPKDIRGWLPEGDVKITFDNNGMIMESTKPDGSLKEGNIVLWCGDDLPDSFILKWKFQVLSDDALAMVFFSARGKNGKNIYHPSIAARDGTYSQYVYGDIDSYHITYYTDAPYASRNITSLWKNSGFYLAEYGPQVIDVATQEVHNATLIKAGGKIVMAIDNWVVMDFFDDGERFGPVLGWGKFGWRQMKWSKIRYSDLELYSFKVGESGKKAQPQTTNAE